MPSHIIDTSSIQHTQYQTSISHISISHPYIFSRIEPDTQSHMHDALLDQDVDGKRDLHEILLHEILLDQDVDGKRVSPSILEKTSAGDADVRDAAYSVRDAASHVRDARLILCILNP